MFDLASFHGLNNVSDQFLHQSAKASNQRQFPWFHMKQIIIIIITIIIIIIITIIFIIIIIIIIIIIVFITSSFLLLLKSYKQNSA